MFNRSVLLLLLVLGLQMACNQQTGEHTHAHQANHLVNESSPYLLQHAYNPVHWYPWGEEALAKAQEEEKLLIISIGYSACHWCHVMEEESFEDSTVAAYMNEHFVNIKVDREERPDIDDIYMTACQLTSNQGCGWPLNAFALPDGRPIGAVTYMTKDAWMQMLRNLTHLKNSEPEELVEYATNITEGIQNSGQVAFRAGEPAFKVSVLNQYSKQILAGQDETYGGQKGAPKFPMPGLYDFLLSYYHLSGDSDCLNATTRTLDKIANGGIYDHIGGGFARYSTDAEWHIPHFEKMLYDNAQLISLYSKAYQLTDKAIYRDRITESVEFLERHFQSPEGGFYSSLDADSEGEEGTFYVWAKEEVDSLLGPALSNAFCIFFDISKRGNWEKGKNVLRIIRPIEEVADELEMPVDSLQNIIEQGKEILFDHRKKRTLPGLDDKILTAWNGLAIIGMADAYRAISKPAYLEKALGIGQFIRENMMGQDHRLDRNFKDGTASINGFLDDYAFTILGFIELYELTFDVTWLENARALIDYAIEHFFDEASGMFKYRSKLDPPLIAEKRQTGDNVIPGSNSSMARSLHTLGLFYYDNDLLEKSKQMMHNLEQDILEREMAPYHYNWCRLYIDLVKPPYEIAIVGPESQALSRNMQGNFLPLAIFLGGQEEGNLELLQDKLQEGETYIYVCQNKVCKFPVQEVDKAIALMD